MDLVSASMRLPHIHSTPALGCFPSALHPGARVFRECLPPIGLRPPRGNFLHKN